MNWKQSQAASFLCRMVMNMATGSIARILPSEHTDANRPNGAHSGIVQRIEREDGSGLSFNVVFDDGTSVHVSFK